MFMKKLAILAFSILLINFVSAQETETPEKKKEPINIQGRANDHLMVQIGYAGWAGKPDSINTGGFSRSFNMYFMLDFPFKSNPKLSVAAGLGIGSDGIKFKKTYVGIKENTAMLQFIDQEDTTHFKKTKLSTTYVELPIELRFISDPANSDKSFKFAIGIKGGYMLNAHTRNKTLETRTGTTINDYVMKEASKRYFNTGRLVGTARIGWGHFTLFGTYQLTNLFKEGVAAEIKPYTLGLTLSGL